LKAPLGYAEDGGNQHPAPEASGSSGLVDLPNPDHSALHDSHAL